MYRDRLKRLQDTAKRGEIPTSQGNRKVNVGKGSTYNPTSEGTRVQDVRGDVTGTPNKFRKHTDAAAKAIKAKVSGDTLTIDIAQAHGTHHLVLAGLGHEYQNSYDATLF